MDWVVFTLTDHRFHVFGNSVVQDAGRGALDAALAAGTRFYPPVDGAVYGSLLNDRATLDAMGDALTQPPHNAPPRAPVLYLKPRLRLSQRHSTFLKLQAAGLPRRGQ